MEQENLPTSESSQIKEILMLFSDIVLRLFSESGLFSSSDEKLGRSFHILEIVGRQTKCSVKSVRKMLNLPGSSATRLIDKLVDNKLVVRKIPKNNRRTIDLHLTEKGKKRLKRLHSHQIAFFDEALKDISEDEKKTSVIVLHSILDYANVYPREELKKHFRKIHGINHP